MVVFVCVSVGEYMYLVVAGVQKVEAQLGKRMCHIRCDVLKTVSFLLQWLFL